MNKVIVTNHAASAAVPKISVVLSTYNQPAWLEKTLVGYAAQRFRDFEVVIADDGSGDETRAMLARIGRDYPLPLRHIWHPDQGFRKCTILNRAIEHCRADYLVFSDGDCIPRADFLAVHYALREPGRFLSGGYCKLPRPTSHAIGVEDIANGCFVEPDWLRAHGVGNNGLSLKLRARGRWARLLDSISTAKASWNGHNASGWTRDLLAVNGFDERMEYGGQDRELGERLENTGICGKRIRFRAICVHLDHDRGYVRPEMIVKNRAIRRETWRTRSTWSAFGIVRTAEPATQPGELAPG